MSDLENILNDATIQSAIVEISGKKLIDLMNQNLLLEANLVALKNAFQTILITNQDLNRELDNLKQVKEKNDSLEEKVKKISSNESDAKKLKEMNLELSDNVAELSSHLDMANQELADLKSKIESGYKTQIRELKGQLEATNGNNDTNKEKSSK